MSSHVAPNASRLRTSWRPTSRRASSAPRRSNLLIATTSAKSSMSIFSSCDAAPNSGVITYSERVDERHDRGVALADAGRLDDHEVEPGRLEHRDRRRRGARAARRRRRGWPSTGRRRSSPSRLFIRIRSPSSAPPPLRRVGSTASTAMRSLSSWSTPEPAHQLVGERGLARAAGAGDAEHRDRASAAAAAGRRPAGGRPASATRDARGPARPVAREQRRRRTPAARGEVDVALRDHRVDHPGAGRAAGRPPARRCVRRRARAAARSRAATITPPPPP